MSDHTPHGIALNQCESHQMQRAIVVKQAASDACKTAFVGPFEKADIVDSNYKMVNRTQVIILAKTKRL